MPKASIVIPAYNASAYITKTLDSILSQSMEDFECLVIDDGSTDDTADRVAAYQDPRIRLIRQPNSGGPARPRNLGISLAEGEYIVIFDSDDIMLPEKLQASIAALDAHPEADMLFTNFQSIDKNDNLLNPNFLEEYDTLMSLLSDRSTEITVFEPKSLFDALIRVNFIGTSSVVLRRSALSEEHRFNQEMKNSEDRLFWTKFIKKHKAIFLNKILHQYRILATSISRKSFIDRAPSKIQGLKLILKLCDTKEQKKCVKRQIARDYAALSYAHRQKGEYSKSLKASLKSLQWGFNKVTLRALAAALLAPLIRRKS